MQIKHNIGDIIYIPYTIVAASCEQNPETINQKRDIQIKYKLAAEREIVQKYDMYNGLAFLDENALDELIRRVKYVQLNEDHFLRLINELRICSSPRRCCYCNRSFQKDGCDKLESDAADAIEYLLKFIKGSKEPEV